MCTFSGLTDPQKAMAEAMAVEWLWALTARSFGTRQVLYRPPAYARNFNVYYPIPYLQPISGYTGPSAMTTPPQVVLLPGPVVSVDGVTIEGATIDPGLWRQEGDYLVRDDGDTWPMTQNMISALNQVDTWAVSYTRGHPVPVGGQFAAGALACEIAKLLLGDDKCKIPRNATTVTRAGVTVQRNALTAMQSTGVPGVDYWVSLVNPRGLVNEPTIWSPDIPRNREPFAMSTPPIPSSVDDQTCGLILAPGESVPPDTPPGTIIYWTT